MHFSALAIACDVHCPPRLVLAVPPHPGTVGVSSPVHIGCLSSAPPSWSSGGVIQHLLPVRVSALLRMCLAPSSAPPGCCSSILALFGGPSQHGVPSGFKLFLEIRPPAGRAQYLFFLPAKSCRSHHRLFSSGGVAARSGVPVPCGAAHSADPDVLDTSGLNHRKLFTDDMISRGHRTFIYLTMTELTASNIIKLEALPNWEFGPHKNFSSRLLELLVSPFDTVSAPKAPGPLESPR